jgi:hypothetical protein
VPCRSFIAADIYLSHGGASVLRCLQRNSALLRCAASSAPLAAAMPLRQRCHWWRGRGPRRSRGQRTATVQSTKGAKADRAAGLRRSRGQGTYNAITRDMEREIMPVMREFGMRAVMYNPLAVRSPARSVATRCPVGATW